MFAAYVAVTVATVVANLFAAGVDVVRPAFLLKNGAEAGIPESWLPMLGLLKLAGAIGLLLGLLGIHWIGVAAATGLVLYFVGAVGALVRARVYHQLGYPAPFLLLAVGSLALALSQ
ncbi:DoxX family protein [Flindersiella endophytica]